MTLERFKKVQKGLRNTSKILQILDVGHLSRMVADERWSFNNLKTQSPCTGALSTVSHKVHKFSQCILSENKQCTVSKLVQGAWYYQTMEGRLPITLAPSATALITARTHHSRRQLAFGASIRPCWSFVSMWIIVHVDHHSCGSSFMWIMWISSFACGYHSSPIASFCKSNRFARFLYIRPIVHSVVHSFVKLLNKHRHF